VHYSGIEITLPDKLPMRHQSNGKKRQKRLPSITSRTEVGVGSGCMPQALPAMKGVSN